MMIYLYYGLFVFFALLLIRLKKNFIVLLPIFNVILDTSFNYFPTLGIVTFFRPMVYLVLFLFVYKKITYNPITKPFYLFFGYTLILVLFSSQIFYSFKGYMQVFISMMCFIIGFIYFTDRGKLNSLNKVALAVMVFTVFSSVMGYVYGIGTILEYTAKENPETIGLLRSFGTYSAAVVIGILPLVLSSFRKPFWRWIVFGSAIAVYVFILLNVRRTAIGIPIVGLLTYAWFIPNKSKIFSGLIVAALVLFVLSPFYFDTLSTRYMVREESGRFDEDFYKTEGRFVENISVFSDVFAFNDPIRSFFGSQIYASGREDEGNIRMYHSDPASLLAGTGIIGFLLYVYLLVKVFNFRKRFKNFSSPHFRLYKATFYSLFYILLFVSLNGSLLVVTMRTIIFLFLGAILSLMIRGEQLHNEETSRINGLPKYNHQ